MSGVVVYDPSINLGRATDDDADCETCKISCPEGGKSDLLDDRDLLYSTTKGSRYEPDQRVEQKSDGAYDLYFNCKFLNGSYASGCLPRQFCHDSEPGNCEDGGACSAAGARAWSRGGGGMRDREGEWDGCSSANRAGESFAC